MIIVYFMKPNGSWMYEVARFEDEEIYNEIVNAGGNSILSKNKHESGSDRIAEACESIDSDAFVNIQGDENQYPLTWEEKENLKDVDTAIAIN